MSDRNDRWLKQSRPVVPRLQERAGVAIRFAMPETAKGFSQNIPPSGAAIPGPALQ